MDGNALIHRGYHAMPGLSTKKGEPTGGVYGFSLILLKAIAELKPTHIGVTFDLAGPTFRHKAYQEYKAHRVKAPQDLYDQIPKVKEVVRALNIPIFEMEGFEADDLLGTLSCDICERCKDDCQVIIVTGDLDTLQLVNDCVRVYTLKQGLTETTLYGPEQVKHRYGGLTVDQLVDYRALRGDASDNIPGVRGIGEKGAIEIIKEFGSIDKLYKAIRSKKQEVRSKIRPRVLQLLEDQEQGARQSYELSKIKCDVEIKDIEIPKYEFSKANFEKAFKLFQDLEFKSLVSKLPKNYGQVSGPEKAADEGPIDLVIEKVGKSIGEQKYILIKDEQQLKKIVQDLSKQKEFALDTETTSVNVIDADLVGMSLCCSDGHAYYIPSDVVKKSFELKKLLEDPGIKKIGHNIKFDYQILQATGYQLQAISFDTMIASYLLNSSTRQHNLEAIAFSELGYHMQPIEELIGKGKKAITMDKVEVEKVSWYAGEDVDITYRLKKIFEPQLKAEGLEKIFRDIEMPLIEVLARMERYGIKVDAKFLNRLAGEAEIELNELESKIYKLSGQEFNINSPKQMKEVLFDKLKLEPVANRKTKTGLSTAAGELEKMLGQHPVIEKIMEYRELAKLQSTYLLTLPELVNKKTGRIHTSYNQTIAATGRLSSVDPNLQNIPIRGEGMGSKIRQAFVAEKGYKLLSIDYSQIELRIVAHLAKDKKMLEVFKNDEDIHTKTAMEIFGVAEDKVTPDMRRDAKTINFGILYGLSSFGLSSRIGEINRAEAKEFIQKYFAAYPAVLDYIEQVKFQVNQGGFVRNELGRIRKFPEIKSNQFFIRAAAERAAVNFPIQSLAADVIKVAMINIDKLISEYADKQISKTDGPLISRLADEPIRLLLHVHDELVFEVKEDKVEEWAKKLIPIMEDAIKLSVPVKVEAKVGDNWGEMLPVKYL